MLRLFMQFGVSLPQPPPTRKSQYC